MFDFIGSFFGIVIFSPIFILCSVITAFNSNGKFLFLQKRLGKNEREFTIVKFVSMRKGAPQIGSESLSMDEQRKLTTKWGFFMRRTSLDELPQLFNILIGDMSFIGPRPGLASQYESDLVTARKSFLPSAYEVKPGLSGYSQLLLKRSNDVQKRARFDSCYVKKSSFFLDIKLFIMSFRILFGFLKGT